MRMPPNHAMSPYLRLFLLLALLASSLLPHPGLAQQEPPPGASNELKSAPAGQAESNSETDPTWAVRLYYADRAHLDAVAGRLDIWEVNQKENYVIAALNTRTYQWLETLGYRLEIDSEKSALLAPNAPLDPRYYYFDDDYSNPNGLYMVDFLQTVQSTYPGLTELIDIGDAWQGLHGGYNRDLWVLRISNEDPAYGDLADKPAFFLFATIHAREVATPELAIRYIKYLTEGYNGQGGYGSDPDVTWLVDYHVVYVLVSQNPDGHRVNEADTSAYRRKNMDNDDGCSSPSSWGVDLNRNSSFFWGCCGGSSPDPCDDTYRGPSAGSEPETQAFQNYFATVMPDHNGPNSDIEYPPAAPADASGIFISLHSYSDLVLWPWDMSEPPANAAQLQTIGRKLAFFNGYDPSGAIGYSVDGATDDWVYGKLGVAAFTFEVGYSSGTCGGFFPAYDCIDGINNANRNFWAENGPSFLYAHKIARAPYMLAYGPEALDVTATPGIIDPGDPVTLTATINDTRYNNQSGTQPTQNIAAAEYYLDIPPWETGAVAVPMSASDGSFDSKAEAVSANLDTSSLAGGKHLLYVRGQDVDGNWGPVSAVFLTTWSGNEGAVSGVLSDELTGEPLTGTVFADSAGLSANSDPATGVYSLTLPAGTWSLRASAALHLDETIHNISVSDGSITPQDFELTPTAGMQVSPGEIEVVLNPGETRQRTLQISNPGNAALTFNTSESELGFTPLIASTSILLVDDDDNSPNVRTQYTAALDALGYSYTVFDVGGGAGNGPSAASMAAYDLVIWFSGDQYGSGSDEAGPNASDEVALATYLDGGGTLFLSSQEYYYDRGQTGFLSNYLGVSSMTSDNGDYSSVSGQNDFSGLGPYPLSYGSLSDYSDSLTPGSAQLAFLGNNGRNAAASTEQTMFFAFPWEAIYNNSSANGQAALQAVIDYLAGDIAWLEVTPESGTVPAQGDLNLTLTFTDTTLLPMGTYSGTLNVRGNAPDNPLTEVLVRLVVGDFSPAELSSEKLVSTSIAHPGETVTYTLSHQLVLSQTHSYTQTVFDALPDEVSVVTSSLTLDGQPAPHIYDPQQHIISYTLSGDFNDSLATEVVFQAVVGSQVLSGTLVSNSFNVSAEVDGEMVAPPDDAQATFTVLEQLSPADLNAAKQVSAAEIVAGETLSYTLGYTLALSGQHGYTLTLQDAIPAGLTLLTTTLRLDGQPAPGLYDPQSGAIRTTLSGVFTDQRVVEITFQAQVGAGVAGGTLITNQATAQAWVDDLRVLPAGQASASTTVLAPAIAFQVWKSANVAQIEGGGTYTYTLSQQLALTGTHNYSQQLYDALPDQVSLVPNSIRLNGVPAPGLYNASANALDGSWSGSFSDQRWITVTYQVQAHTDVLSGTQVLNTHLGSAVVDGVHPAGPSQASDQVSVLGPPITLGQNKSASTTMALTGEVFTYTLQQHLALTGTHTYSLELLDNIPAGLTILPETIRLNGAEAPYLYRAASNRIKGNFNGSFTDEHWVTVTFQVQVNSNVISGTLILNNLEGSVTVDGVHFLAAAPSGVTVRVFQSPELSLAKQASLAQAYAGQVFTYTLQAGLALPGDNPYVLNLFDSLPTELEILTDTLLLDGVAAPWLYDPDAHAIQANLSGRLIDGLYPEISYQVRVVDGTQPGTILTNMFSGSASVAGLQAPDPGAAWAAIDTITPPASFLLDKEASVAATYPGQVFDYSLTAQLSLPGEHSYSLLLEDVLPLGLEIIVSSIELNHSPAPELYNESQGRIEYTAGGSFNNQVNVTISFQVRATHELLPGTNVTNLLTGSASVNGVVIASDDQDSEVTPVESAPFYYINLPLMQK
ncbi:MAG: hypothetical protein JW862_05640 [Anaerolineales bacterium]|nr:hypothetical protein [Anaerolineales bacterium]